jgi:hypothetical protein
MPEQSCIDVEKSSDETLDDGRSCPLPLPGQRRHREPQTAAELTR